jgi:hypothetical protein
VEAGPQGGPVAVSRSGCGEPVDVELRCRSARAELANHERVERGAERRRHLPGHGDAAPRQPEDHDVGPAAVSVQQPG